MFNAYGATEANLIGMECPWTAGLHVTEDLLVLEVVDENDRPVPPGVAGHKLLVTTLFNRTLPFIRYELSDLVTVADGPCPCGRPHLRLASVQGRREDVLSLPARNGGHGCACTRSSCERRSCACLRSGNSRSAAARRAPGPGGASKHDIGGEVLRSIRRAIAAELDRAGAAVEAPTVEAVAEIGRSGTGAKEKLVSLAA